MSKEKIYKIDLSAIKCADAAFADATAEELRVLLALIAEDGNLNREQILQIALVKEPRLRSALALWEACGVLTDADEADSDEPELEFGENPLTDPIGEEEAVRVADSIRDEGLRDMISECAALMHRPGFSTQEIKWIAAAVTQLGLSQEYVLTLAAHLSYRTTATPRRLLDEAQRLQTKGIDTVEELERYIQNKESESADVWEFRHLLGIYNRALTPGEKKYFNKWAKELGYSSEIVGEAYSIAVNNTGKLNMPYMNKLLVSWHDAGCRTVEDCRARVEKERAEKQKTSHSEGTRAEKSKSQTAKKAKYTDFDTEDALMKALRRSYGTPGDDGAK